MASLYRQARQHQTSINQSYYYYLLRSYLAIPNQCGSLSAQVQPFFRKTRPRLSGQDNARKIETGDGEDSDYVGRYANST